MITVEKYMTVSRIDGFQYAVGLWGDDCGRVWNGSHQRTRWGPVSCISMEHITRVDKVFPGADIGVLDEVN